VRDHDAQCRLRILSHRDSSSCNTDDTAAASESGKVSSSASLSLTQRAVDTKKDKAPMGTGIKGKGKVTGTALLSSSSQMIKDKVKEMAKTVAHTETMDASIADFYRGATAAQQAQIKMIVRVFEGMDADKDGLLSAADVRAYFRSVGRSATDGIVHRWIAIRDVDQDGAVSLAEFVASYSLQLDPTSASSYSGGSSSSGTPAARVSPVTPAFGAVCLGNSPAEVQEACVAAEEYVRRILDSPAVQSYWRIFVSDESFSRRIGRLFGGVKLMQALGFEPEQNGTVLALRDPSGRVWDSLPADVRVLLNKRLGELKSHEQAMTEPSVSNVAAGMKMPSMQLLLKPCSA
jgi:Ca2+-binding EF-hand superfamily protein